MFGVRMRITMQILVIRIQDTRDPFRTQLFGACLMACLIVFGHVNKHGGTFSHQTCLILFGHQTFYVSPELNYLIALSIY